MLERYKEYIHRLNLFTDRDLLVIAVSGGIDSAVLVNLCHRAGFRFVIAHVNFNLREQESVRDESFVRELAKEVGVKLFVKSVNTTEFASANNMAIQEAARVLRYDWFGSLRETLLTDPDFAFSGQRTFVVTAHHLDDSVESMLMNLFRGTGITGLRGILPLNGNIARPMLCFTKQEIVDYAKEKQLTWVEDSSNQLDKYTRNYFRNQLIPMIRNIYPQVDHNLYHNLQRFNEAGILYREAVNRRIRKTVVQKGEELHIPVLKLQKMSGAETILFEILQPLGFSAAQTAAAMDLLGSETGRQLKGSSHRVIKNRNWLIIAPNKIDASNHFLIEEDESRLEFENRSMLIVRTPVTEIKFVTGKPGIPENASASVAYLDAAEIKFPLMLRRWKTGDYFYPLGMKKKKKIARFLIDAKFSKISKESIWVIESGKKILWVVGHRVDDRFRITTSTTSVLVLNLSS